MENPRLFQKCAGMPVPLLPAMLGVVTLSNIYGDVLGFAAVRHAFTWAAMIVWAFALYKAVVHFRVFREEYCATVSASLYPAFLMLAMSFGAYLLPYIPAVARGIWLGAVALHALHILLFTYRNVLKRRSWDTFVPTWFVTYNGILVAAVVGRDMGFPSLIRGLFYYGIAVYIVLISFIAYRLVKKPFNPALLHSKCIVVAPISLCLVAYLNAEPNLIPAVVYLLYAVLFLSLLYTLANMPKFLRVPFTPGFAGITFPNAIAAVASIRFADYLASIDRVGVARVVREVAGFQIFLTTAIIAFVLFHFGRLFLKSYEKTELSS